MRRQPLLNILLEPAQHTRTVSRACSRSGTRLQVVEFEPRLEFVVKRGDLGATSRQTLTQRREGLPAMPPRTHCCQQHRRQQDRNANDQCWPQHIRPNPSKQQQRQGEQQPPADAGSNRATEDVTPAQTLGEPPQGRTMRYRCGCNRRAWHGLHYARYPARKKRPGRRLRAPAPAYSEGEEVGFFGKDHNHRFAKPLENADRRTRAWRYARCEREVRGSLLARLRGKSATATPAGFRMQPAASYFGSNKRVATSSSKCVTMDEPHVMMNGAKLQVM